MAMYLGSKKVAVTNTIEKQIPSMKAFFEAGGKCAQSVATSFDGCWQYDDTANVTDFSFMFWQDDTLVSVPRMNFLKATSLRACYYYCESLKDIPSINAPNLSNITNCFGYCSALVNAPTILSNNLTTIEAAFSYCGKLVSVPLFDTSKVTNAKWAFRNNYQLVEIPKFNFEKVTNFERIFYESSSIEAIHAININANLDISPSTKFTREALLEILGNLKTQTSGTKTLTMGSTNLAKLTDEDKAIATNKGWTLA